MITSAWREYIAAISATLITATAGTTVGWTSPTIPILLSENSPIPTTRDQSSWIASLMILSSAVSPVFTAYMADRVGRKSTLLFSAVPYMFGWIVIYQAQSVTAIYFSRIISGLAYGVAYTTAPMYLGEIASDNVRGSMTTLITVMSKIGILAEYCIGPYVSIQTLASFNILLPILFVLAFMCQPESPYYHLKNGHVLEAESALQILRRKQNVKGELESMKKHVEEDIMYEPSWSDIFYSRGNRKALAIILGVYTIQQFCGSTAIIVYAQQIFGQAKGGIRAEEACILFGSVQVLTSVISSALVDRLGRKPLLLVSCTGVGLSNLIVALYFTKSYAIPSYVTQFSIVVFISAYTIGLATVPFAITSEMFPTNVKALATCIIQTFTAIITFTVTKLYQVIADNVGTHVVFWVFTLFSLSGILFISILLPETKGQSFDTIQKRLNFKPTKLSTKDGNQQELS